MSHGESSASEVWQSVTGYIRAKSEDAYKQWFKKMVPVSVDEKQLILGTSDSFFANWVMNNCGDLLNEALASVGCEGLKVTFEYGYGYDPEDPGLGEEPPLFEQGIDESADGAQMITPELADLIRKHSFDNFVVGEENRYAYTAALSAAQKPGTINPLYIYGGSGMGKTHLLLAVAHEVRAHNPTARVCYITCENFLNAFLDSLRTKTMYEFRETFRNVDYLLVDDVHTLGNKTSLQEEFFNTFNTLYGLGRQIILTSDRQPSEIPGLENRLVSRFFSGVTTQITQSSFETRLAILKQEQQCLHMKLGDDILTFIAERISSNIRPLKGALMSLSMYAAAMRKEIDLETAKGILSDQLEKEAESRTISIEEIQKAVAEEFGIQVYDLTGPKKPKNIAEPRMIAMYLSRKLTTKPHQEIGRAFGGRSHGTVIHAVKQIEANSLEDEELRRVLNQLQRKLRG
ncbi:MAG: chromosomal replication initiator protein DnaA [Lentisphaeria bacterium]|nr:chromosomal replication initiator protein DnaA [Lentisphaeria bacterium]